MSVLVLTTESHAGDTSGKPRSGEDKAPRPKFVKELDAFCDRLTAQGEIGEVVPISKPALTSSGSTGSFFGSMLNVIESSAKTLVDGSEQPKVPTNGPSNPPGQGQFPVRGFPQQSAQFQQNANPFQQQAGQFLQPSDQSSMQNSLLLQQNKEFTQQSNQFPQQSNQFPKQSNQLPQQSNQFPQQSNQLPQQSNQFPQQSNQFPQQSNQFPHQYSPYQHQSPQPPSPDHHESSPRRSSGLPPLPPNVHAPKQSRASYPPSDRDSQSFTPQANVYSPPSFPPVPQSSSVEPAKSVIASATVSPVKESAEKASLEQDQPNKGLFKSIKKGLLGFLYPEAHEATDNLGDKNEAYFDAQLDRWVFPGQVIIRCGLFAIYT
jgi:hypothetical protein